MSETDQVTPGNQDQQSLGWRSALPDEFKEHEFVKTFQKPGDFVKSAIEIKADRDVLKAKLDNSIPKLPENATQEERDVYYTQLGRPEKPEQYEIPEVNGQKNSPEMVSWAQKEFHRLGIPAGSGKELSTSFNTFMQGVVKAEMDKRALERTEAETKLKSELGVEYDTSVEMVRRVWKKHSNSEFDTFVNETKIGNDPRLIRWMINIAKLTGEDKSIDGMPGKGKKESGWFPNTPDMATI